MKTKYLAGLLGSSTVIFALSVVVLILSVKHTQFRASVGHDKPAFDRFVAKVEGGKIQITDPRFSTNWFAAMKQDHGMIQMEEQTSDRMAARLVFIGSLGLLTVLFQSCVMFFLRKDLQKP
jgi:hypothetical protein